MTIAGISRRRQPVDTGGFGNCNQVGANQHERWPGHFRYGQIRFVRTGLAIPAHCVMTGVPVSSLLMVRGKITVPCPGIASQ